MLLLLHGQLTSELRHNSLVSTPKTLATPKTLSESLEMCQLVKVVVPVNTTANDVMTRCMTANLNKLIGFIVINFCDVIFRIIVLINLFWLDY